MREETKVRLRLNSFGSWPELVSEGQQDNMKQDRDRDKRQDKRDSETSKTCDDPCDLVMRRETTGRQEPISKTQTSMRKFLKASGHNNNINK